MIRPTVMASKKDPPGHVLDFAKAKRARLETAKTHSDRQIANLRKKADEAYAAWITAIFRAWATPQASPKQYRRVCIVCRGAFMGSGGKGVHQLCCECMLSLIDSHETQTIEGIIMWTARRVRRADARRFLL
jgi:hypothetical protein